jgi:hypothetical protein
MELFCLQALRPSALAVWLWSSSGDSEAVDLFLAEEDARARVRGNPQRRAAIARVALRRGDRAVGRSDLR